MENLHVFVLEDDTNLRELLCETLEDEGYQVGSTGSGREAVARVAASEFDLLIVDVRMEGISGLDAFSMLKQQGIDIACLVITGYATEEDSIRAIRLGVGDYLRKPFDMRQFLLCVKRLTAHYLSQRELQARHHQLHELLEWTLRYVAQPPPEALHAARVARTLANSLGLQKNELVQIELALLVPDECTIPEGEPLLVKETRQAGLERWDGKGPGGLRGEDIPLAGRILHLARCVSKAAGPDLLKAFAGEIDPFLTEQWIEQVRLQGSNEGHARRLLGAARALLQSGDSDGASLALREIEPLANAAQWVQLLLLRLRTLPAAERPACAEDILQRARRLGEREEAPALVEVGLAVSALHPHKARAWIEEGLGKLRDSGPRARAWLALWSLDRDNQDSPQKALHHLLLPAHENYLASSLPWLWSPLISWWMKNGVEHSAELSLMRRYNSLLQAGVTQLSGAQRSWLAGLLAERKWATALLQQLSQDPGGEVRSLALSALRSQPLGSHGGERCEENSISTPLLRILSLGSFEVSVGGEPIADKAWRGMRNKYLLTYLACAGRPVSEDRLVSVFWDEDLEKGKKGLYNGLSHLRKLLRPAGWQGELDYAHRHRDLIGLKPESDRWFDAEEFEKSLIEAGRLRQSGNSPLETLRQACALYQGPFLENCFMDWAIQERGRLEQEALRAFLWLSQLEETAGDLTRSLESAQRALSVDNCSHNALLAVIKALLALRRPEEAIRVYEAGVKRLRTELDIEPSLELFELYQRARLM